MLKKTICPLLLFSVLAVGASATELTLSVFEQELSRTRFSMADPVGLDQPLYDPVAEEDMPLSELSQKQAAGVEYKSPAKAFAYSLLVPGLGQYYYGSKIKPAVFLATEVVGWVFALKYHGRGEDATIAYEDFNRTHWFRDRYYEFLYLAYDTARADTISDSASVWKELTEVLPDTETQQYFEMTGKYDQFAWGWDDAIDTATGHTWDDIPSGWEPDRITTGRVPYTANRITYEGMRDLANDEYSKSMRFVFALMANHLISAFEAYFTTKRHNNNLRHDEEFSRLEVDASLRSYSSWKDTPYLTVTYKF